MPLHTAFAGPLEFPDFPLTIDVSSPREDNAVFIKINGPGDTSSREVHVLRQHQKPMISDVKRFIFGQLMQFISKQEIGRNLTANQIIEAVDRLLDRHMGSFT